LAVAQTVQNMAVSSYPARRRRFVVECYRSWTFEHRESAASSGSALMRIPDTREGRIGCLLAFAIVVSPFLALLYGVEASLVVLAMATGATAWLALSASRTAASPRKNSLIVAGALNAGFALISIGILVSRIL
jgi:hypothetical protein